jgi:hypothetical protein
MRDVLSNKIYVYTTLPYRPTVGTGVKPAHVNRTEDKRRANQHGTESARD